MDDPVTPVRILALIVHDLPQRPPEPFSTGNGRIGVQIDPAVATVRDREGDQFVSARRGDTGLGGCTGPPGIEGGGGDDTSVVRIERDEEGVAG